MDLRALIAKMDEIESIQVLTESEDRKPAKKQEREVELPSGAKVKATKVQGWQSQKADKEADKERKKNDESITFKSSIAQALLKEFGYQVNEGPLDDIAAWHQKNSDALAAKQKAEQDMKDPANVAAFKKSLTPSQLKWVGGADLTDPIIRSRIPAPQPGEKPGGQAASPAKPAAPTGTTAQGDDEGNTTITKPDGTTMVVGPDGNAIKPGSNPNLPANKAQASAKPQIPGAPGAQDDATGVDAAVAANAADDAKRAAAGGQAASPAAPAKPAAPKGDPKVLALQQELIKKGAKIKADGIMGPQTQAAQKQFGGGQAASPAAPAAPAAAAAPAATTQTDDEGNTLVTTAGGKTAVLGPDGKPLPNGGKGSPSPVPPTADKTKPYWVGGTRYEFKGGRGGGSWKVTATPQDKLQWNSTRARSMAGYTGADDQFKPGSQAASPAAPKAYQGQGQTGSVESIERLRNLAGL